MANITEKYYILHSYLTILMQYQSIVEFYIILNKYQFALALQDKNVISNIIHITFRVYALDRKQKQLARGFGGLQYV